MSVKEYLTNGWSILNHAVILCANQTPLPISSGMLTYELATQVEGKVRFYPKDDFSEVFAEIVPGNSSYTVALSTDHLTLCIDGKPEQNIMAAYWLRSLMPEDAPRMIVSNGSMDVYSELPYGVTPDQIAAGFLEMTTENIADDPDLQRLWGIT